MPLSSPANLICFAHRGASGYEPENTMRSFTRALELGATWIECDIRVVEDELVVFHDRTLERLTGTSGKLGHLDLGTLRTLKVKGTEPIPLLSEVVELLHTKAYLQLELKGPGTGERVGRYLTSLLKSGWHSDAFLVSSFDHEELAAFKNVAPSIPIGVLLYGYPINTPELAKALGAYSVHLNLETITPKRVSTLHQAGFKVFVYTVNDPADIEAMRVVGVDGVFSDFPDRVLLTNPARAS
jgi:glycerophosphoryl diester phosphodiesterase